MFERLAVFIALLASLATLVGLLLEVRSENRVVEMQVLSADQLTRLPSVNGLDGEFSYNGVSVTDLWRLRLRFLNSGNTTLIGQGSGCSLLGKSISIAFPPDVRVLDASPYVGSFYVLTEITSNSLDLEFSQWRQGEDFETIVYVASDVVLDAPPFPSVPGRPIIDGQVVINDLTASRQAEPRRAIDYLPAPVALVGKILGGLLSLIIGAIAFGVLVVSGPASYFRAQRWKSRYSELFRKHLDSLDLEEDEKAELLKKPWRLSGRWPAKVPVESSESDLRSVAYAIEGLSAEEKKEVLQAIIPFDLVATDANWKGFEGPRLNYPTFESLWGTLLGTLVGLALVASCLAIIASMISM